MENRKDNLFQRARPRKSENESERKQTRQKQREQVREKKEDGGKGVGMIEREGENTPQRTRESERKRWDCKSKDNVWGTKRQRLENGELQTEKIDVGEVRERPRRRT